MNRRDPSTRDLVIRYLSNTKEKVLLRGTLHQKIVNFRTRHKTWVKENAEAAYSAHLSKALNDLRRDGRIVITHTSAGDSHWSLRIRLKELEND